MNRMWLIPLVSAVVAGFVAYGVTRHSACCSRRHSPDLDRLQDVSLLVHELQLNDAQAVEVKRLHTDLAANMHECCMCHCAARARLVRALAADTNGTAQADAVIAEMCRAYEKSERATLDHIRQVRAVLNAEQRKHFDALITEYMCGACDMPCCHMPPGAGKNE